MSYLIHYGIKGQKWGEKNGPPYPLGKSQLSYSEKQAMPIRGRIKIKRDISKLSANARKGYDSLTTDDIKNFIDDTYFSTGNRLKDAGLNFTADLVKNTKKLNRLLDEYDERTGLPLKQKELSPYEDMKAINPGYDKTVRDTNYMNCASCSMAYELRRRGYDVMASQNSKHKDLMFISAFFDSIVDFDHPIDKNKSMFSEAKSAKEAKQDMLDILKHSKNGDRGFVVYSYTPKNSKSPLAHMLNYEIINNKFVLLDSQSNVSYDTIDSFLDDHLRKNGARLNTLRTYGNTQNYNIDYNAARFAIE